MRRQIVAVEDVVAAFLLALEREGIEGETFLIAMTEPLDYPAAAQYAADRLGIETVDLVDPIGHDFRIDITKARNQLGYRPKFDIHQLIDRALDFRHCGQQRRQASGYRG